MKFLILQEFQGNPGLIPDPFPTWGRVTRIAELREIQKYYGKIRSTCLFGSYNKEMRFPSKMNTVMHGNLSI